jgi:hypothetical protein
MINDKYKSTTKNGKITLKIANENSKNAIGNA